MLQVHGVDLSEANKLLGALGQPTQDPSGAPGGAVLPILAPLPVQVRMVLGTNACAHGFMKYFGVLQVCMGLLVNVGRWTRTAALYAALYAAAVCPSMSSAWHFTMA